MKLRNRLLILALLSGFALTSIQSTLAQDSWITINTMPVARFDLAVVAGPGGRYIYAIGGVYLSVTSEYLFLNHVDVLDTQTTRWRAAAHMSRARAGAAAVLGPDGVIYVLGGYDDSVVFPTPLNTVEAYDPASDAWTTKRPMPTPRGTLGAAMDARTGHLYAIGGASADGSPLDTVEEYDPVLDTWILHTEAHMPTARYALAAVANPDGLIYAIAGSVAGDNLATVEVYNSLTDSWATKPSLRTGRYNPAAAVSANGRIYVIGGFADEGLQNTVEMYDGVSWTFVTPMATARYDLGAATDAAGHIHAVGGFVGGQIPTVEVYTP